MNLRINILLLFILFLAFYMARRIIDNTEDQTEEKTGLSDAVSCLTYEFTRDTGFLEQACCLGESSRIGVLADCLKQKDVRFYHHDQRDRVANIQVEFSDRHRFFDCFSHHAGEVQVREAVVIEENNVMEFASFCYSLKN